MKTIVLLSALLLGACATGTLGLDREVAPRARVTLDLAPHADAEATRRFPALVDARLPSADRLGREIRTELGEAASVEVTLCVAAAGTVETIEITRSSRLPSFDAAVKADAPAWQFERRPGPAGLRSCERATITYRPHA